jgi:hypothetical protein
MSRRRSRPLWLRAIKDPEAQAFLKANAAEFPVNSFLPDPIEFGQKRKFANQQIADLMASQMPFSNPHHQRLAELFLSVPPREIAGKLDWPRSLVYSQLRALKRFVLAKHRREKAALLHGRGRDAELEAPPDVIAIDQVSFTLHERTATAYLVSRGNQEFWVDEAGVKFSASVQECLNELEEHREQFEILDVAD